MTYVSNKEGENLTSFSQLVRRVIVRSDNTCTMSAHMIPSQSPYLKQFNKQAYDKETVRED